MTSRRTTLPDATQSFHQEVLTGKNSNSVFSKEMGAQVLTKVVDSLPELIELAKRWTEVKKIEAQAEAMSKVIREQTKAFVEVEMERRKKFESKAQAVSNIMRELTAALAISGITEEVQKMLIETYQQAMRAVVQEKSEEA
ncbi:hypothetical protein [Tumebacillus flagellatus]|uniref:Uncharacterized protein n=1 Tax=Tumebacillus flagellatus TaxID=1157490 RepID=A0A074LT27_9BACL|nr:hypothetical protein [Tumebacillus flagellatus]KEO84149.1 hypothetical protein EL26_06700 [Tumebacillus flagellatus]